MAGVDYAKTKYTVDERRMGVTGYSVRRFPDQLGDRPHDAVRGGDLGRGDLELDQRLRHGRHSAHEGERVHGPPWDPKAREILRKQSPIEYVANIKTPTMFLDGESDHRVPIEEAEQMYTALRKLRVPARMVRYPDSYHGGVSPGTSSIATTKS